ncbi:aquaporin [Setomelanomma holmii]|uniref:Aquaporin n=1 Tax=Setomelanomma holmii TaxID=210430 RepID=A0A9P4LRF6_9PLEO|nr:aquaporin [Setomelanomma holmii]
MTLPGMKPRYTEDPDRPREKRLPGFGWLPNRARYLLIACIGEFVGTFLFLFFAFAATQVANNLLGDNPIDLQALMYISLAFGFSLAVNVWIFFRVSGGLFNPAVTIAMALIGAIGWVKASVLILTQVVAGIASAGLVSCLFSGPLAVRTSLSAGTSVLRGLFIEMFLTFQLIFCIFMLAAEKHRSTFLAPIGIGLALFVAQMAGVSFTGGSLNPARSFGPDVVLRTFDSYHWIYWIGPVLGAILAVVFYRLIKALEYETANPDADGDGRDYYRRESATTAEYDEEGQRARRMTDGTNESDFATRLQCAKHNPVSPPRPVASSHYHTTSMGSILREKPSQPSAAFAYGGDGHHSDDHIDHPTDRPRAQHGRGSRRSSHSHYEREPSDDSYRSGPSAESGSSP